LARTDPDCRRCSWFSQTSRFQGTEVSGTTPAEFVLNDQRVQAARVPASALAWVLRGVLPLRLVSPAVSRTLHLAEWLPWRRVPVAAHNHPLLSDVSKSQIAVLPLNPPALVSI
jgi:hypothetical protein